MPTYCFKLRGSLERIEVALSVNALLAKKRADGGYDLEQGVADRDFEAEHGGFANTPGNWPLKCEASGVHPSQIRQATEQARQLGVPTDFAPNGAAILRDRDHRKRYLKAHGLYDKSGGYGD